VNGTALARRPGFAWAGITALTAAWTLAVLGTPGIVPYVVTGLTALAGVAAVILRYPAFSAAMLPVALVGPQLFQVFSYELFLFAIFLVMLAIGWQRRSVWLGRLTGVELVVLAMILWGLLSAFWAFDAGGYLFGVRRQIFGLIALWVAWRLSRFVDPEILLAGIPLASCAVSLAVVFKAMDAGFFGSAYAQFMRTSATDLGWGFANYLAAIVALMLPTGIYLALHARRKRVRLVGWATIPLAALLVTISASRGGAVLLVAIALFAIFRTKVKPWMAITAGSLLLLFMTIGPGGQLLIARFSKVEDSYSIVARVVYLREAWNRTVDHWPVGMGLGQSQAYPDRLGNDDPHNYWLSVASEFGLVGLVLWIVQAVIVWRRIRPLVRDPETEHAGRALQLTFGISQLNLLFEPTFTGLQYPVVYYWVLGVYFGIFEQRRSELAAVRSP
jgi:hypothetical protein